MTKVSKKSAYPTKNPIAADYFIGTDSEDNNKTVNFAFDYTANLINKLNGGLISNYMFRSDSAIDFPLLNSGVSLIEVNSNSLNENLISFSSGVFITGSNQTDISLITKLYFHKNNFHEDDLTPLFNFVRYNSGDLKIKLQNTSNLINSAYLTISNVVSHGEYFVFDVLIYKSNQTFNTLLNNNIYVFNFDINSEGLLASQGPRGIDGIDGTDGINGIIGATGSQGIQGVQGTQGIQGDSGKQGIEGIQGLKGEVGFDGKDGIQGIQGSTGIPGQVGSTGQKGVQGVSGINGEKGDTGEQGISGINGTSVRLKGSVLTINDLPTANNESGDLWVVTDTGNGYVWNGNAWTNVGPIQGPKGDKGTTGTQGAAGAAGSQGIAGSAGTDGVNGAKGDTGAQGATGPQGQAYTGGLTATTFDTTLILNKNNIASTGITFYNGVLEVRAILVCKVANNGYSIGETATILNGQYPIDGGRTAGQGITIMGTSYNGNIEYAIGEQFTIAYNYTASSGTNNGWFSASPSQWNIRFIIYYFNSNNEPQP